MKRFIDKILVVLVLLAIASVAKAQISSTVEVSNQYRVNIGDIRKPVVKSVLADSLLSFNVKYDYSIFDKPYLDLYDFSPKRVLDLEPSASPKYKRFSVELGAQYPFAPQADILFQVNPSDRFNFNVIAHHNSLFAKMPYLFTSDVATTRMNTKGGVGLRYTLDAVALDAAVSFGHIGAFDSMGEGIKIDHNATKVALNVGIHSVNRDRTTLYYDLNAALNMTNKGLMIDPKLDSTYREMMFDINGSFGADLDGHIFHVDIRAKNATYGSADDEKREGTTVGLIDIVPQYEYNIKRLALRAGVRFGTKYTNGKVNSTTTIYPDVDVKFEVIKNALWLRGIATGGDDINTMSEFIEVAPWFTMGLRGDNSPYVSLNSRRPIDARLSLESVIAGRFSWNVYGRYVSYQDNLQLRTHFLDGNLPVLMPTFTTYQKLQIGTELEWRSQSFKVEGAFRYNCYYAKQDLYMLPQFEGSVNAQYNLKRRLFIELSLAAESAKLNWDLVNMPAIFDLGCRIDFLISKKIGVFVKGENLLNNKIYYYAYIPQKPLNVGGGVSLNF